MVVFWNTLKENFVKDLFSISVIGSAFLLVTKTSIYYIKKSGNDRNLAPFYDNKVLREVKKKYIRTRCQNINPSNEHNFASGYAFTVREDLIDFFLKKVFKNKNLDDKFYLILGDAGMGKTTFLMNLFSKYYSIKNILFSLTKIKLLPLGENYEKIEKIILGIENKSKTILLLDALDESPIFVTDEEINNEFDKLINLVCDFKIVMITCRTNFFTKETDEPFELKIKKFNTTGNGYHKIKKLYISPFDDADVTSYINKTYSIFQYKKRLKATKLISNAEDLFIRPMLLSYIKDLINSNKKYNLTFEIYETLLAAWVARESNRYPHNEREKFKQNLYKFSNEIALYIYANYSENGLFVKLDKALEIAKKHSINLNNLEIKSRTLMNRNSEGSYKFSHKSIYEFFLAYFNYTHRFHHINEFIVILNINNLTLSKKFVEELQLNYVYQFGELPYLNTQIYINDFIENCHTEKRIYGTDKREIEWDSNYKYKIKQVKTRTAFSYTKG
ncbi:MAG: hypothetical protein M0D53_02100 [Flavobacterium sp. JAD_PAG50586_2]|nr:MAG: hypothetical protein M0D53_02100 [Flavobacterium sp. JAD_PAG50586_2]